MIDNPAGALFDPNASTPSSRFLLNGRCLEGVVQVQDVEHSLEAARRAKELDGVAAGLGRVPDCEQGFEPGHVAEAEVPQVQDEVYGVFQDEVRAGAQRVDAGQVQLAGEGDGGAFAVAPHSQIEDRVSRVGSHVLVRDRSALS